MSPFYGAVLRGLLLAVEVLLFTHYPIHVGVAHVLISRVPASDRGDAVGPCFRAGDAAVAVVVLQDEGVYARVRRG